MTISEKEPVRDADPSFPRASGIDPVRMAIALEVFEELDELPVDHPQAIEVRRATARLYKTVKQRNRKQKRAAVVAADEAVTAAVDVTDFDALAAFADAVVDRFGRIDLWINNAGVLDPIGPLVDAAADVVAGHVATNVTGVAYGTMLFARHVAGRAGGGVLVNVSSGAAVHPYAGLAVYSATKAAVDALTEAVAEEEARHGLRAHAVTPGHVDTAMQAAMRATDDARFPAAGRFRQIAEAKAFNTADWVGEKLLELAFAGGETPLEAPPVRLRVPPMGDAADRAGRGS